MRHTSGVESHDISPRVCLAGAEVSIDVFESAASIVSEQAENRPYTMKAVMVNAVGAGR